MNRRPLPCRGSALPLSYAPGLLLTNSGLSVGTDRLFHRETRQYHRRKGTLLLCSGWKQVFLPCQKHRHSSLSSCIWRFWNIRASERVSLGFNLVLSQVARPISTSQLHMLPCFHFRPIKQVIFLRPLGTQWSGRSLLEPASRLDAFSGYPFQT